jgi:N-acetylglucosaminyldiphosphoundecaprenol N-acetyl-beta-D-mannosaminyltransferase
MKEARMAFCEAEAACLDAPDGALDRTETYLAERAPGVHTRDCTDVMGVLIDRTSRDRVLAQIDGFVQSGKPHQVVTVNVDFLNIAHQDRSFVRLLNAAALSVPDGMPLVWLSRVLRRPLPERITGTDLILNCADLAAQRGYRMFLLGAAPGVADEAAALLATRYPGLRIVGTYAPPACEEFDPEENARIIDQIRAARPDMLFVALGTPKQERWIYQNLEELGVPVCIGVGGVFNFITGRLPRAPEALQQAGLEWLFRLMLEPRRLWRRYLVDDTRALWRALHYAARQRGVTSSSAAVSVRPIHAAPSRVPTTGPARPPAAEKADWPRGAIESALAAGQGAPKHTLD